MKELVILVGPPASGKSTHASTHFPNHLRISQDDQGKEYLNIFNLGLTQGLNIVVDRMNHTKEQRSRFIVPARLLGYKVTVIYFGSATKDLCLERATKREGHPTIKNEKQANRAIDYFFKTFEGLQDNEFDTLIVL